MPKKKPPALKQTVREKAAGARQVKRNIAARARKVRAKEKELDALNRNLIAREQQLVANKDEWEALSKIRNITEEIKYNHRPPLSSFIQYDGRGEILPEPEPISPLPEPAPFDTWVGWVSLLVLVQGVAFLIWYTW